jgi:hypothetical protein
MTVSSIPKPGQAQSIDVLRADYAASDIVRNARLLIGALRAADQGPEALAWATEHAMPAFLVAEQELARLQGLPLRGTALAQAQEQLKSVGNAVNELQAAVRSAAIPANALEVKLPAHISMVPAAIAFLKEASKNDPQSRPAVVDWNGWPLVVRHDDDPEQLLAAFSRRSRGQDADPAGAALEAARQASHAHSRIVFRAATDEEQEKLLASPPRPVDEVIAWVAEDRRLADPPRGLGPAAVNSLKHPGEVAGMTSYLYANASALGLKDRTGAPVPAHEAVRALYEHMEAWIRSQAPDQMRAAWADAQSAAWPQVQQTQPRPLAALIAELTEYGADPAQRALGSLVHEREIASVVSWLLTSAKDAQQLREKLAADVKLYARPRTADLWARALEAPKP